MYLNFFTALWMVPLTQSKDDCCRRSKWKGNRPFDFLFDQTCSTTGDNGFISPLSALWSSVPLNMSLCTHMLIQFSFEYAHAVSLNWLSVSQRLENFTLPLHSHTHTHTSAKLQRFGLSRAANLSKSPYFLCRDPPPSAETSPTSCVLHLTPGTTVCLGDIQSALVLCDKQNDQWDRGAEVL